MVLANVALGRRFVVLAPQGLHDKSSSWFSFFLHMVCFVYFFL